MKPGCTHSNILADIIVYYYSNYYSGGSSRETPPASFQGSWSLCLNFRMTLFVLETNKEKFKVIPHKLFGDICVCDRHRSIGVSEQQPSDSLLNGSGSHMATCQQAGGGNIILRRKAAAISPRLLVRERTQRGWTRSLSAEAHAFYL